MIQDAVPMQFSPTLPPEEAARANFYALLARLFYGAPDSALLAALAGADEIVSEGSSDADDPGLALAWRDLSLAAAAADLAAVEEEYQNLFVGVGKARIPIYASAYLAKSAVDAPLVELRDFLARRQIARRTSVHEPEDHIAALCELMRYLIAEQQAPVEEQMAVFDQYLHPAVKLLCDAICKLDEVKFYRSVASFAESFFDVEYAVFRM
ncbi:MAG TPA: molecular chaperone TorD family protein [Burkholderiales bacterium]|nr:molecular chaperone TorD family protein [Burkholderiales bacterium]